MDESDIEGNYFGARTATREMPDKLSGTVKWSEVDAGAHGGRYIEPPLRQASAPQAPTDSKIAAAAKKSPLNMIPLRILKGVARVFQFGAKKHGRGNFLGGTDDAAVDRYIGGNLRHIADCQHLDGSWDWEAIQRLDPESGLYELDHAICGLIMLRGIAIKKGVMQEDPGEAPGMAALK